MAQINFAPGIEDGGMATMMADIIKGNLKEKPDRENDFNAINGNIYLMAEDAEVEMTMAFNNGNMVVHNGKVGNPKLCIVTDSNTLLDLAKINIKFGMPYYFDAAGREVVKKLLTRKLKISGMFTHLIMLTHFTKLMSVS
jgi:hypothetical protein